ncbi:MAG: hydrogenase nickel incorporation protein HypB [Acidobacteria bacterium]|nr:hydrogenase nickel incorporation protein HypB [Acidobacteriota bacterium]
MSRWSTLKDIIKLEQKVLSKNDEIAARLAGGFRERGIFAVNMISSPGSGKTSLLEAVLPRIAGKVRCAVLEGDVQTENDARRIEKLGVPVRQIITCGSCHLDSLMIEEHLDALPLDRTDLLFIENVGNLVCPSSYSLGEDEKLVVLSAAEGDDKPLKYPAVFRKSSILVVNKIDLIPLTDFDLERAVHNARGINPKLEVFPLSCRTGEGVETFCEALVRRVETKRAAG